MYTVSVITKKRVDTYYVLNRKSFREKIQKAFSTANLIYTSEYKEAIENSINKGAIEIVLDMCVIRQHQIDSFSRKEPSCSPTSSPALPS